MRKIVANNDIDWNMGEERTLKIKLILWQLQAAMMLNLDATAPPSIQQRMNPI